MKSDLRRATPELYVKLGLESAKSLDDIHRILRLHEVRLLEQRDELEQNAAGAKADLISELTARAAEKDTIRKATFKVFAEMGFDMFPQQETDTVFEWLNNNQAVREGLGVNALFDIENGILGYKGAFTDSSSIPIQGKIVFAKVFNKLLTGNAEFPVAFDDLETVCSIKALRMPKQKGLIPTLICNFLGIRGWGVGIE